MPLTQNQIFVNVLTSASTRTLGEMDKLDGYDCIHLNIPHEKWERAQGSFRVFSTRDFFPGSRGMDRGELSSVEYYAPLSSYDRIEVTILYQDGSQETKVFRP